MAEFPEPRADTYVFRFDFYGSPDGSPSYDLEEVDPEGDYTTVSVVGLTRRSVDDEPDPFVLMYDARRGEELPSDRSHLERDGRLLVLQSVEGGEPRRFETVGGFLCRPVL